CDAEGLMAVCDLLTGEVSAQIKPSTAQRAVPERPSPGAAAAHLAYLKGRYLWNKRTEQDLYRSIEEFRRAVEIEPGFAIAHAGLADAYILLGIWGLESPHSAFRTAKRAAEGAIELNDGLAEAHTSLAEVFKDYEWDWPAAEGEFERAMSLNPNYAVAH